MILRLLLALCLLASPAAALRPITPPAPEFPKDGVWVNSVPFSLRQLRGRRVVLVTFLNFYSINSIRTIPFLNRLWETYALKGLMIIGIHNPDYDFDRNPAEVRDAVERFGIKFPVYIDTPRLLWKGYANEGWPSHYLVDHKGLIVHDRIGEGGYLEFEEELLDALLRFNGYVPPADYVPPQEPPRQECGKATPPFYLGSRRGQPLVKAPPRGVQNIVAAREGEAHVVGTWEVEEDALRYKGSPMDGSLHFVYQGAEAVGILNRVLPRPARVYLKQNELWLNAGNANADVKWDDDDRSYVLVDRPRLYYLTRNPRRRPQELELIPEREGVGAWSFEFSDYCQTEYDHK